MACRSIVAAVLGVSLLVAEPAFAVDLVALVEDVSGVVDPPASFSYLATAKVIELGHNGHLVVDYLGSCVREAITGGTVTIGIDQSQVTDGMVKRERVECDGAGLRLTPEQSLEGSGIAMPGATSGVVSPHVYGSRFRGNETIYGAAPLIDFGEPLPLTSSGKVRLDIERLDVNGESTVVEIEPGELLHGRFYDFAASGRALAPGGVYRMTTGGISRVVTVHRNAANGAGPVLSRLVRL